MKTKLLVLLTILLSFSSTKLQAVKVQYEWSYVNTISEESMNKISTVGLDTVFIVGYNFIARSTDRGVTWKKQTLQGNVVLMDVIFCNHTTGFAVGWDGVIMKTTDGGENWTPVNSGTTANLNAIAATSVDNIWAVGSNGTIVSSKNQGETWEKVTLPATSELQDISFRNGVGYIVGDSSVCFTSSDSGNTWTKKDITVNNSNQYSTDRWSLLSVSQTANHNCIWYGLDQRGSNLNVDNKLDWPADYICFTMRNDSVGIGFSSHSTGGIREINVNTGKTYAPKINVPAGIVTECYFPDIHIVNDSIGYIVSGSILLKMTKHYVEADNDWTYTNTISEESMQKLCTVGLDTVYVVGGHGLIARSVDRALTWNKQYSLSQTTLNDIIFCNRTTGFAVGNGGVIMKTTDAGESWVQMNSGTTTNLNAIASTDINNVWTVGDNGTVLFSKDQGSSWQRKELSATSRLNDISFRNGLGYIVGDAYTCFVSTDYGDTWTKKDIRVENPLHRPVEDFCLLSVVQTDSHNCICYGFNNAYISNLNVDDSLDKQVLPTGFTMKNDSIGYEFSVAYTTCGCGEASISIYRININNGERKSLKVNYPLQNKTNDYRADIKVINDSIGYIVSGSAMFKIGKPTWQTGLHTVRKTENEIRLKYIAENLIVESNRGAIKEVEIFSLSGCKMGTAAFSGNEANCSINTLGMSNGIYILRATYQDKSSTNLKWIKK